MLDLALFAPSRCLAISWRLSFRSIYTDSVFHRATKLEPILSVAACGSQHQETYIVHNYPFKKLPPRDRCNDFKNIFAEKFGQNIGVFCSNYC
jgi:hypothetical protein